MPPISKKVVDIIMLKIINIAVNPKIKKRVVIKSIKRFLPVRSSSPVVDDNPPAPPRILRYEGINGSTQGEKNDKKPAANVSNIDG